MDAAGAQKVRHWIEAKWRHASCPVCESNDWQTGENLAELRSFHDGGLVVGGSVYPVLPVFCSNCGYALLINAVIADLLPDRPASDSHQPSEDAADRPPVEQ